MGQAFFDPAAEKAFHDSLSDHGIRLGTALVEDEFIRQPQSVVTLQRQWQCDGFAFAYNFPVPPALVRQLKQSGFPAVWFNQKYRHDAVYPDNIGGAVALTRQMIELGHTRITFISSYPPGDNKPHFSVQDRIAGYTGQMEQERLKPDVFEPQHFLMHQLADEFRYLLGKIGKLKRNRPTAFIFYSSQQANTFALVAAQMGFRIPQDFSISTFGIAYAAWSSGLKVQYAVEYFDRMGAALGNMIAAKVKDSQSRLPAVKVNMEIREGCETVVPPQSR